jgi:archaemetzincin
VNYRRVAPFLLAILCFDAPVHAADALPVTNPDAGLCILPLEPYPEAMLPAVVRGVTYVYGFRVDVLEPTPLPKVAWYPPRKRWRADELLDWMHEAVVDDHPECQWFVGLTRSDVSTTKPPHEDWGVLGLGELGGRTAVVSSFRTHKKLKPPHTATRRVVKVVNHEIGHMMGLPHQKGDGCLMNDAEGTVLTTDQESGLLCAPTVRFIEEKRGLTIPRHATFEWEIVE